MAFDFISHRIVFITQLWDLPSKWPYDKSYKELFAPRCPLVSSFSRHSVHKETSDAHQDFKELNQANSHIEEPRRNINPNIVHRVPNENSRNLG